MSRRQGMPACDTHSKEIEKLEKRLSTLKADMGKLPPLCSCMTYDRAEALDTIYDWMVKKLIREQEIGVKAAMVPPPGYDKSSRSHRSGPAQDFGKAKIVSA